MSQEPKETKTPSDAAPRSRAVMAVAYLATMFAAGLGLVYATDGARSPGGRGTQLAEARGEPVASAQPEADLAQLLASSSEQISTLDNRTRSLTAELSSAQARIMALEQSLEALKVDQVAMLEVERDRLAGELRALADQQAAPAAGTAPDPETQPDASLEGALAALGAEATPDGARVTLAESQLRFRPGKAELDSQAPAALAGIAKLLKDQPGIEVVLRGYTDSSGDAEMNLALSEQRARAVRDVFVDFGIDAERIQAQGLGEAHPVADNATPEGQSRNRRVEVLLVQP
ncbi:OmpA family protein [Thiorhodococcus mannitoliphagus]|uniref:OmpA family protein n=1 Tax=Thiorhodococcus mannitoliphagus TaxID=329406 RepID=A0A6P1DR08_9GAMM|nr:OmpA family protein [Thiorhodococcus mannitoliphagus]NEX20468.1 OmpA family protein [Thiorhodococcus mannitoliphagus]